MSYQSYFNLKSNPFRLTPAIKSEEIVWAGFPDLKKQFETRIKRSIKIPNSTLVLNWGEYGSGKTHASRYFGKKDVLEELAVSQDAKVPFFINITLPKGKTPLDDFYTSILDKLDITYLRSLFQGNQQSINEYIDLVADNEHIKSVLKAVFTSNVDANFMKRYLYGSTSGSENKSLDTSGILRAMNGDTDYSKILSGLFTCITFEKQHYSSIILWVDEFEDIAVMTKVNGDKTNSFLRELLDNTPNNLLIFLNLTQSALFDIEDLGEYISDAVKSRIKTRINFEIPKTEDLNLYVKELLTYYRPENSEASKEGYYPFEEHVLNQIFDDLQSSSLRGVNESLGLLLDIAEMEQVTAITADFYIANKPDVIGDWK